MAIRKLLLSGALALLAVPGASWPQPGGAEAERGDCAQCSPDALAGLVAERGARFRDCPECPEMAVVRPGALAMGVYEVTFAEFERFMEDSAHVVPDMCRTYEFEDGEGWVNRSWRGWRNPGFDQEAAQPVVCVNWDDAVAYAKWLSAKTNRTYRLPREREWALAAGLFNSLCKANLRDQAFAKHWDLDESMHCDDGHPFSAPVGSFPANALGLHDLWGNAWEWMQDCWDQDCTAHVVRGGAWGDRPNSLRPVDRDGSASWYRGSSLGFRVVRVLAP